MAATFIPSRFYEDLGKDARDLLDKGFPAQGGIKLTTESRTANGVSLTTTGGRTLRVEKDKAPVENVVVTVEPKFDWREHNMELSAKLSTANTFEGEVAFKDFGSTGTKVSFRAVEDPRNGVSTTETVSFRNENVAVKVGGTYPFAHQKPLKFTLSGVARFNNTLVGVDTSYDTAFDRTDDAGKTTEVAASATVTGALAYLGPDYEAGIAVRNFVNLDATTRKVFPRDNLFTLGFYQRVSLRARYGVIFAFDQSQAVGPEATVGGEYRLDDYTTLKGRFAVKKSRESPANPEFRVGLGAALKVTPSLTATLGADLNVRKLLGTSNVGAEPSFGAEFKLVA